MDFLYDSHSTPFSATNESFSSYPDYEAYLSKILNSIYKFVDENDKINSNNKDGPEIYFNCGVYIMYPPKIQKFYRDFEKYLGGE